MEHLDEVISIISRARIVDLEHPRQIRDPVFPAHWPGYVYTLSRRHEPGLERRTSASGMIVTAEHAGTHMDALCHQAEEMQMFGGIAVNAEVQTPTGFTLLGIETVPPVFRRGVLLDIPAAVGGNLDPQTLIPVTMLQAAIRRQHLTIETGNVILIRTGYGALWKDADQYLKAPGISGEASEWLASFNPFAVGCDNMAWDLPGHIDANTKSTLPGHSILLVQHGIYILENLFLEELSLQAPSEFLFVVIPLKFKGGTGSPVRPLALVVSPD